MKRHRWLGGVVALAMMLSLVPASAFAAPAQDVQTFTFYQTSDMHGRTTISDAKPANNTLLANIAGVVNQSRAAAGQNEHVVLLDGGDALQGTLDSTYFGGGEQIVGVMKLMGYDYTIIGNHEFNYTTANLLERVDQAADTSNGQHKMQYLCANVFQRGLERPNPDSATMKTENNNEVLPYEIVDYNGVKVAYISVTNDQIIFGVEREVTLAGLDHESAIEAAKRLVPHVREQGADIVVMLTHQTIEEDAALARAVDGIDIMLGSHVHATWTTAPNQFENKSGPVAVDFPDDVIYMQGKNNTNALVQLKVSYNPATKELTVDDDNSFLWDAAKLGAVEKDATVQAELERLDAEIGGYKSEEIATAQGDFGTQEELSTGRGIVDTTMSSLVADFVRDAVGADVGMEELWTNVTFTDGQKITRNDAFAVLPYENVVIKATVTPAQLKAVLEANADVYGDTFFCSVSGMKVVYDLYQPSGSRVRSIQLDGEDKPLDMTDTTRTITLAADSNMTSGGNGFGVYKELGIPLEDTNLWTREAFMDWLEEKGTVKASDHDPQGRLEINLLPAKEQTLEEGSEGLDFPMWTGKRDNLDVTVDIVQLDGTAFAEGEAPVVYKDGKLVPVKRGEAKLVYTANVKKVTGVTNYGGKVAQAEATIRVTETGAATPTPSPTEPPSVPQTGETDGGAWMLLALGALCVCLYGLRRQMSKQN